MGRKNEKPKGFVFNWSRSVYYRKSYGPDANGNNVMYYDCFYPTEKRYERILIPLDPNTGKPPKAYQKALPHWNIFTPVMKYPTFLVKILTLAASGVTGLISWIILNQL